MRTIVTALLYVLVVGTASAQEQQCREKCSDQQSVAAIRQCLVKLSDALEREMDVDFKKLKADPYFKEAIPLLGDAQRSWRSYRSKKCVAEARIAGKGSAAGLTGAECSCQESNRRRQELANYLLKKLKSHATEPTKKD